MAEQRLRPPASVPQPRQDKGEKKWLIGGLVGFVVILLITAVVLLLQIKKPVEPLPSPRPRPSPVIPTIKVQEPGDECQVSFRVSEPEIPACYEECDPTDDLCEGVLECTEVDEEVYVCANPECENQIDCVCEEEILGCFVKCNSSDSCEDGLSCEEVPGTHDKRCVKAACPSEEDCVCPKEAGCFDECDSDEDCVSAFRCMTYPDTGQLRCLDPGCRDEPSCICPIAQASVPPTVPSKGAPAASPRVEEPELPEAGVSAPAVLGVSAGLLLVILGLLF